MPAARRRRPPPDASEYWTRPLSRTMTVRIQISNSHSTSLLERDDFRLRQHRRSITSPSPRSSRGEGWGEGLLSQIPNMGVRGDSPSPGFAIRPLPASGARWTKHPRRFNPTPSCSSQRVGLGTRHCERKRSNPDLVIPGWSEGPDLRCAIAHRGILGFRVRRSASPRNDGLWIASSLPPSLVELQRTGRSSQ